MLNWLCSKTFTLKCLKLCIEPQPAEQQRPKSKKDHPQRGGMHLAPEEIVQQTAPSSSSKCRSGAGWNLAEDWTRTVAGKSSVWVLYVLQAAWHSKIWQKFHSFIVFHISIWAVLELFSGVPNPPKSPGGVGTRLNYLQRFGCTLGPLFLFFYVQDIIII